MNTKEVLHQVQKTVASFQIADDTPSTILRVAETIATNFSELGISGGRLYERRDENYELIHRFGQARDGELGILVPADYLPIERVLERGAVVMDPTDPGVDRAIEKKLGAHRFAAIAVGDEFLLSFNVSAVSPKEDILDSLNIVRHAINQKLLTERYESLIEQAQEIQQSILPQVAPRFDGFDVFGRTIPAAIVSGDFYDFLPISDSILGLAIADATGHGLPAALMVRDIHMGLRMGADRDFKIVRTLQKLNQIIHQSRLTTKFVSLFYGELETGGTFIYTNAGHPPPFLLHGSRSMFLDRGGAVLGPTPGATYTRGYVSVDPGDVLCLYSDGVIEAVDRRGREFGIGRLQRMVREHRERTAEEICRLVLDRVCNWGPGEQDDRTIVIVKANDDDLE